VERVDPSRSFFLKSEVLFGGDDGVIERLFQFVGANEAPRGGRARAVLSQRLNRQKTSRSAKLSRSEELALERELEGLVTRVGY
jgi:hypothetical protein